MKRISSSLYLSLLAIVLSLAAGAIALQFANRHAGATPQQETLSTHIGGEWTAFGGSWKEADHSIEDESEERGAKLMNGSQWQNYYVEADVELLGSSGDAGLIIRSSGEEEGVDSYHGYFAGIRNKDHVLFFGRADFGWNQYAAAPLPSPIEIEHWYHLRLLAFGCNIAASVMDEAGQTTRVAAQDPHCLHDGRMGLKSYSAGARWKNIRVGPATEADLKTISAGIQPILISDSLTPNQLGFSDSALDRYMEPIRREARSQHVTRKQYFINEPQPIGSLGLLNPETPTPVVLHGVVTITSPAIYIQDSSGSIVVRAQASSPPIKIGDEVEVQGLVELHRYTPVLRDATIRILWSNIPISPLAVGAFELAAGGHNGDFAEVEGTLLSRQSGPNDTGRLELADGTQRFYAIAGGDGMDARFRSLSPGSRLRLRGIVTYTPSFTGNIVPFAILLPAAGSVDVIALPSWWTPAHISTVVLGVCLLVFAVNILIVRVQRWRLRAVLKERERLALDMHDTLAQSFAGISFQLQAIRSETPPLAPQQQSIETALAMVRSSHEEAKRSIAALRPAYLGDDSIIDALAGHAQRLANGRRIKVETAVEGRIVPLPLQISDAMFRIGQEAISNSVRHADASTISLALAFDAETVTLTIHDDGCGFSPDSDHVGLGLRGMDKRARDTDIKLEIASVKGAGTNVRATAQLHPHKTLTQRLEAAMDFVTGE